MARFEIKNKKAFKTGLSVTAFWLMIIAIMLFIYLKNPERNLLYADNAVYIPVVVPVKDIEVNEEFNESNVKEVYIDEKYVAGKSQLMDYCEIIGKKAGISILSGEFIYNKDVIDIKKEYEQMIPFPIEVDEFSTIANILEIGDCIDINITNGDMGKTYSIYDEEGNIICGNYRTVVEKKRIEDLRSGNGVSIRENRAVPKYAIVYLSEKELNSYLAAYGSGTLFMGIYPKAGDIIG